MSMCVCRVCVCVCLPQAVCVCGFVCVYVSVCVSVIDMVVAFWYSSFPMNTMSMQRAVWDKGEQSICGTAQHKRSC